MKQLNLKQLDLVPYFGSKSRVSEVLNGKRSLTIDMARNLHKHLSIPATVLLGQENAPSENAYRSSYPIKEIYKKGWFNDVTKKSIKKYQDVSDELIDKYFKPYLGTKAFNRTGFGKSKTPNEYAIEAWRCRVLKVAKKSTSYDGLTHEFVKKLASLSMFDDGPKLAIEALQSQGIEVVIVSHLNQTYLDGAALLTPDGFPVIGLTLRHDRLDNFWFTLFHEIGHVMHHLRVDQKQFFDNSESGDNNKEEEEANKFALDNLISEEEWILTKNLTKASEIRVAANRLGIHPSIIAGRLRKENKDYSKHRTLVGQGAVRASLGYADNWPV